MSESEYTLKKQAYEDFQEYVQTKMRSRKNPRLDVCSFRDMGKSSMTHLELYLTDVDNGTADLYTAVSAFKPGSELVSKPSLQDGTPRYVAFIPFVSEEKERHHHHSSSHRSKSRYPPTWIPQVLILCKLCLVIGYLYVSG